MFATLFRRGPATVLPTTRRWQASISQKFVSKRSLICSAAVNPHNSTLTAVSDCLDRVVGNRASAACDFAVIFFEGHDGQQVQEAIAAYFTRRPNTAPVFGCSLEDRSRRKERPHFGDRATRGQQASPPNSEIAKAAADKMEGMLQGDDIVDGPFSRSQSIVTIVGLGFEGRVEAMPVSCAGGSFPDFRDAKKLERLFCLPGDEQSHFLMLGRRSSASDLSSSLSRVENLMPGGSRLAAISAEDETSVVSSFPVGDSPAVGVCLVGNISRQEQAELASKTLGAFGVSGAYVSGVACDELFVPSWAPPPVSSNMSEDAANSLPTVIGGIGTEGPRQEFAVETIAQMRPISRRMQMCVFKLDDFLYPGMKRRYFIFEPRYRALVKRCISEGQPLLLLPLSSQANLIGTAAYVTGLENVRKDGSCEIEITGVARCHVETMWMKGESFGLHEAVVERFEDDITDSERQSLPTDSSEDAPSETAQQDDASGESDAELERANSESGADQSVTSEVERLRIQVSAILHKELFRTHKDGFSPLWPGWKGVVLDVFPPPKSGRSDMEHVDPCDLNALELSFWASQRVSADEATKMKWLSCRSTEERLRLIRDTCEGLMSRVGDRWRMTVQNPGVKTPADVYSGSRRGGRG